MANPLPLHARHAEVTSGDRFRALVEIPADEPGPGHVIFEGDLEIAERIAYCWNAQYGTPTNRIPSEPHRCECAAA